MCVLDNGQLALGFEGLQHVEKVGIGMDMAYSDSQTVVMFVFPGYVG